ncbi:MAG: Peptide chain release factor 1 [Parcubacteria group bacterium GW2011_GWE2_39_37]|uniref:Peptide chain release factor 1 n=1 Tax=Candidatus Falkowbacteria bacterium GW2011_GWF2_39_8 TaxID=1618642 RepID=A0A0G0PZ41_9BACT|nr:MAG: Peptide chain release factor 1 [Parcubacteria group bacterium GW2011_GWE2_39_37]KKR33404.1 MAG: Peptide chain release factor 1 [Candidatus Falkowbacteria bacterium GW2011_GWF2_39_8]
MYEDIKEKLKLLDEQLSDPANANDQDKIRTLSQQRAEIKDVVDLILELEKINNSISQNKEILQNESDKEYLEMAEEENKELETKAETLKAQIETELHPADPDDKKNIIMEIRAGTGGDESALFAADLFRMYSLFAGKMGWKIELLDSNPTGIGGYKEIVFSVAGKNVYSNMKYESGTHRVQRVPETEKAGRIHTSAATVAVLPEATEVDVQVRMEDLRIDTYAASGPGGQKVNTTNSAIRITHLPTGLVVTCQDQKSQQQNKVKALEVLRSRLYEKIRFEQQQKEAAQRKAQIGTGDRSEKIRTYNFPQDRISDHRIKLTLHSIDRIMNGELDEIISALKTEENRLRSEQ